MARTPDAVLELRRGLGAALKGWRQASLLDQSALGRITNYSRTSIAHIEAGRQCPGREFWQAVDQALHARGELLAHFDRIRQQENQLKIAELQCPEVPRSATTAPIPRSSGSPHEHDWQRDDVNRRELLRLVTVTGSLLSIPSIDIDRLVHGIEKPRQLDSATVDTYERLNAELWTKFSSARSKREILPAARRHLAILHNSLNEPQEAGLRRRLCALAGDLFQLCGEIFFDSDHYADAAYCYSEAAHASKEAREFDLWACAMTRHAFIGITERQYDHAAPLLDAAAHLAVRGNPDRSTRYWVAAVQAQTHAGVGDLGACRRALDKAQHVNELSAQALTTGWLRFEGSRLDEERGSCYVTLRRPDLAEPILIEALKSGVSTRRRSSVLADLATVGAQRGDVDQLLMHGAAALDIARQTSSAGYLGRKLGDLRTQLVPYLADRHVRYLDSQLKTAATAPAPRQ
ncbi:helix-turn-helix domain-containing protein [Saccharopolyspora erythraea]|uniref:helix-turn-helix domain-containing protein n=1 Tax=Saccharopolyspora erythraea TaxID=1836 RepID=UPI001BA53CC6|nr:helix-turn-helix transcriptional regulator [Saccharopolyspora erythraea]QUH02122.1 helix-turn-helix domain-containing protein [Saccharopolyspora erythraea]